MNVAHQLDAVNAVVLTASSLYRRAMATPDDLNHSLTWPLTLAQLRDFSSRLLLSIHGIAERDLRRPERAGRWSILNVIAHLSDLEVMTNVRIRMILAQDGPLPGFDQERFVEAVHSHDTLAVILEQFGALRRMNLLFVDRLSDAELARDGDHPEYGVMTIRQLMNRLQRHQERHLQQIEVAKNALGLRSSDRPDVSGVVAAHLSTSTTRDIASGIRIRDLWRSGVRRALQVELDAGAQWPGLDYHVPGPEEVYVVAGDFDDGANEYGPGSFLHHPAGSSHSPRTREGCTLFVFYPEG
jgi:DinB superfamily/ChrR Cupin-like domain